MDCSFKNENKNGNQNEIAMKVRRSNKNGREESNGYGSGAHNS